MDSSEGEIGAEGRVRGRAGCGGFRYNLGFPQRLKPAIVWKDLRRGLKPRPFKAGHGSKLTFRTT
jgi:hypothetical protein